LEVIVTAATAAVAAAAAPVACFEARRNSS